MLLVRRCCRWFAVDVSGVLGCSSDSCSSKCCFIVVVGGAVDLLLLLLPIPLMPLFVVDLVALNMINNS